jgi:cytochrome c oxidase subunit 2
MIGRVFVMDPNDYQAWLAGGGGLTLSARGERLFQQLACVGCHLNDGSGRGPSLAGLFGRQVTLATGDTVTVDDSYIRESILTPQVKLTAGYQPLMPTYQGQVNEEGVMSLIEYIKSMPAPPPTGAVSQVSAVR